MIPTVDGRNPKRPPGMYKSLLNFGINYQPQLVIAGFLPPTVGLFGPRNLVFLPWSLTCQGASQGFIVKFCFGSLKISGLCIVISSGESDEFL